jgi:glucan biosynthesis protein C
MSEPNFDYRSRYYFFNVIKICCIFFVFFYHATKIFDADNWHVKNPVRGEIGSFFLLNLGMAVMPLFFFISGGSVWFSIQKRSLKAFIMNLFKRFILPLVFGFTILAWPQVYLERLSHGDYHGSLWSFFPHYFEGLYGIGGNFAWMGLHLWYLGMLFIFSILLLPYFAFGKRLFKRPFFKKLADSPLVLILFALITVYPGWKLFPGALLGVKIWGGWNFAEHFLFFASGFFLFSSNDFIEKITPLRWGFLALAVLLTAAVLYWKFDPFQPKFRSQFFTFQVILKSFACWARICAMLGINYRYFNVKRKAIDYLSNAVLPFYILNQPIMIWFAFYIVHWDINNFSKFLLIAGGSLVVTMLLYELIKGLEITRWLFGIPAKDSVNRLNAMVRRKKKALKTLQSPVQSS